jgi:hypothetical protein
VRARALWVLLGLYLAARLVVVLRSAVFTSYDSFSYAYRTDPSLNRGPLVSFVGGAPRLWGVPLFYAPLPSDALRVYGQWALGTIAWSALAVVVWTLLRHPLARLLASGGVLVLALTSQVGSWDFAILSESLSISLGVLALALLLRWLSAPSKPALVGLVVTAVWWTFTRPDIRVFTVLLVATLVFYAIRDRGRRRNALLAAGVLLLSVAWCTAIGPATARTYVRYAAVGADEGFLYQLRLQVLPDPAVRQVFQQRLGMPDCPATDAIATEAAWRIEDFAAAYRSCPALAEWGARHQETAMREFARAAPGEYSRMTTVLFGQTLIGAHYASTSAVLPARLSHLVYPPDAVAPLAVPVALVVAFALALAARSYSRKELWWVTGLAGACLISAAATAAFGVGEFKRFGVQEAAGLRLAILLLVAVALDAILARDAVGSCPSSSPAEEWENVDADRSTRGGVPSQE